MGMYRTRLRTARAHIYEWALSLGLSTCRVGVYGLKPSSHQAQCVICRRVEGLDSKDQARHQRRPLKDSFICGVLMS